MLRCIAAKAGVSKWSSKPDNVRVTKGVAMVVAADDGERVVRLPIPMALAEGGPAKIEHRLTMEYGEVRLFVKK